MNKRGVTGIESDLGQIRLSPVSPAVAVRPYLTSKEKEKTSNLEKKKNYRQEAFLCPFLRLLKTSSLEKKSFVDDLDMILHILKPAVTKIVKIGMTHPPKVGENTDCTRVPWSFVFVNQLEARPLYNTRPCLAPLTRVQTTPCPWNYVPGTNRQLLVHVG